MLGNMHDNVGIDWAGASKQALFPRLLSTSIRSSYTLIYERSIMRQAIRGKRTYGQATQQGTFLFSNNLFSVLRDQLWRLGERVGW